MNQRYEIISAGEAEERFGVSADVDYPFAEFTDEQEIRLYPGGLHVDGTMKPVLDEPADWLPYNLVIDGDLTVDGDLSWYDWGGGNFVLVTGDLRARNVLLSGCPTLVVRGDLIAGNGVQGHHGDDGGCLVVRGATRAELVVSTLYFTMAFEQPPEAIVIGDPYRLNCPVDFDDEDIDDVVEPDLLDEEGRADERMIERALAAGRPILRPGTRPAHLVALEELDRLLEHPDDVTELDLSGRRLRGFPEQIFALPRLRSLSLAGNALGPLPDRIGELSALEELDLEDMGLTELPAGIGRLTGLRILDVSDNDLRLPEELGALTGLRVLRADGVRAPLPESLGRLAELTELRLHGLRGEPSGVPFPAAITRLPRLRVLDLSNTSLADLPDELAGLTGLEELRLDNSLAALDRLPRLSRLPALRTLRIDGRGKPDARLLDAVWDITTLEDLGIDRWDLTGLPEDAFARMPGLRVLDLSFNQLTTLPESFYALPALESVNLEYTRLDTATLDRLRAAFPRGVRFDLRNIPARDDPADPGRQEVRELVRRGSALQNHDRAGALAAFEQALDRCVPGARHSDYDEVYALYGAVDALVHLRGAASGAERDVLNGKLVGYAERALAAVPEPGMIWHFTDHGAFQEEVTRRTGNALAWTLLTMGEPGRALAVIDRALTTAAEPAYDYARDTKVRILLALGRAHEAYTIVDQVLTRDPGFGDFQDLRRDPAFQDWRSAHSALTPPPPS
ncbi:leucine-rich repeat domain-containing protein [Actinomadura scrupuli]|uniref:leucine-rich repeat domain-containing protein n=1 Tax=Actinomadura scrupuli TaxID=559629 RepID=UPI003D96DC5E